MLAVILQSFLQELYKCIYIQIITSGFGQQLSVTALKHIAGLRINTILGGSYMRIDLSDILQSPVAHCNPVALVSLLLIIAVHGQDNIIIAEHIKHLRV